MALAIAGGLGPSNIGTNMKTPGREGMTETSYLRCSLFRLSMAAGWLPMARRPMPGTPAQGRRPWLPKAPGSSMKSISVIAGAKHWSSDSPLPGPCTGGPSHSAVQAAFNRLRIASAWFALIRPTAMASMTTRARQQRVYIFASPRMVCFSKPKLTSRRLLTRSTAVRLS